MFNAVYEVCECMYKIMFRYGCLMDGVYGLCTNVSFEILFTAFVEKHQQRKKSVQNVNKYRKSFQPI